MPMSKIFIFAKNIDVASFKLLELEEQKSSGILKKFIFFLHSMQ